MSDGSWDRMLIFDLHISSQSFLPRLIVAYMDDNMIFRLMKDGDWDENHVPVLRSLQAIAGSVWMDRCRYLARSPAHLRPQTLNQSRRAFSVLFRLQTSFRRVSGRGSLRSLVSRVTAILTRIEIGMFGALRLAIVGIPRAVTVHNRLDMQQITRLTIRFRKY